MKTKTKSNIEALENLDRALVEDILTSSDEDLLAELREEGLDPEQIAKDMRGIFEKAQRSIHNSYIATKLGASS